MRHWRHWSLECFRSCETCIVCAQQQLQLPLDRYWCHRRQKLKLRPGSYALVWSSHIISHTAAHHMHLCREAVAFAGLTTVSCDTAKCNLARAVNRGGYTQGCYIVGCDGYRLTAACWAAHDS